MIFFIFISSGYVGAANPTEPGAESAARSLQAFVSYHRLYQLWWSNSASGSSQDKLVNGNSAEPCRAPSPDGLDFDVLVSEQHAEYQAAQRSVREAQEKLSSMVLQHSRADGRQTDPAESHTRELPDSQRSADAGEGYKLLFFQFELSD